MEDIIAILIDAFILNMDSIEKTTSCRDDAQDAAEKKEDDVAPPEYPGI